MGRTELQIYFSFSSWLQTKSLLSFETQNFSFLLKNSFSGVQRSTTSPISLKFSLRCSHFLNSLECLSSLDPYTKCWKSQGLLCIDLFHFCSVNVVFFFFPQEAPNTMKMNRYKKIYWHYKESILRPMLSITATTHSGIQRILECVPLLLDNCWSFSPDLCVLFH